MRVATIFLLLVTAAPAQGILLDRALFSVPDYNSIKGIKGYASREEYAAAVSDKRFRLEKLAYKSANLKVFAYVYSPVRPVGRLPAVIFNRGSFIRDEFAGEALATFHRLAQSGFVVIAPMYRQSGGGEGRDEMGGADVEDLMATAAIAGELGFVDTSNLFMYGESRGGMMTYQAVRDGYPLRAAAVYGAFTDLQNLIESAPQLRSVATGIWPDFASNADAICQRRSAVRWAERLNVPLLIMHGGSDKDVPPAQSLALAARLEQLKKPYELIIRAGEDHIMSNWRAERDAHAIEWFRSHMGARTGSGEQR